MQVEREKILEEITKKVTRDDGKKFTDTEKLDFIKSKLETTDYEIFKETNLSVIYKKKDVDLKRKVVLISSHVDCERGITEPDFMLTKKGNYKGTFDNAATNAAVVIAMIENKLADNIIISFTGDEENDSKGAEQVMHFLEEEQKEVIAISLDVTFDLKSEKDKTYTTYKKASYTIDNLCSNTRETIAKELFGIAKQLKIPFMVTRAENEEDYFENKEDTISCYYDKLLEVEDVAYEDEAIMFSKNNSCIGAFSLCLPTNDKEDNYYMHSNELIKIKKNAFDEYIEAVSKIGNRMAEI